MKRLEKKRKQKKVVLMATLATAAVIVGGMTFAWYNAQDKVTNRFSASANFGASLVEEFAPPTDWQPGTKTEKKVSVVNTGTVDAFARAWLTAEMRVVSKTTGTALPASAGTLTGVADPRENAAATNAERMGLVGAKTVLTSAADNTYFKVLDTTANSNNTSTASLSEVQAIQAGGYLAYAPNNAAWSYTVKVDETTNRVIAGGSSTVSTPDITIDTTNGLAGYEIDADTFVPETEGLYLFRRNMDINNNDSDKNVEYSGYYFVPAKAGAPATYYALETINSGVPSDTAVSDLAVLRKDGTLVADDVSGIKLFTAKYSQYANDALTWADGTGTDNANTDYASNYLVVAPTSTDTNLKVYVQLENILGTGGTAGENWTKLGTGANSTFYYNNDLESGDTTANFVKEVQLNKALNQDDFITFDFDLNVNMDSVQVTTDTDGKELTTSAADAFAGGSAPTKLGTATAAYTDTDTKEISSITWTAASGS